MIWLLLAVSLAVLVVGLVLRRRAQQQLAELHVAVIWCTRTAAAPRSWFRISMVLPGKPDYVRREGDAIPVERKSCATASGT